MLKRILDINAPIGQSLFLWGARQTGKSSYLKAYFPTSLYIDLLNTQLYLKYLQSPHLFREELLQQSAEKLSLPIIIDEIQKVPMLLDEVHWLIENKHCQFILCGSSARKLKSQSTNLLGGRAWIYHFYPLVYPEIPDFNLLKALQQGLLPKYYLQAPQFIGQALQGYIDAYLTDEIRNEGLVRNLASFSQFLTVSGLCSGDMINMSNIARDCHINRNTVQNYFQILIDTLLGYFIYPYHQKVKRDLIVSMPKFYLFDVGVANYLAARKVIELKGEVAGRSFEHYILMEIMAYKNINHYRFDITYWRTKTGLEVDFILGDAEIAIEVKINQQVHKQDLSGIIAFLEENPKSRGFVISQDQAARQISINKNDTITVLPWREFLSLLWDRK